MRKLLLVATVAAAALATPSVSSAAVFFPGDPEFTTAGDTTPPITGVVTARIGREFVPAGSFTDTYTFIVDVDGFGSGTVGTSLSGPSTDINFSSITINGITIPITGQNTDVEFAGLSGFQLFAGAVNELIIEGTSTGGSYGGNITFTPAAVPEPATWGMMLAGFGALGFAMRRRQQVRVSFA
jgi:hypothetical protein